MYYRPTLLYLCILIINYFLSIDMQKPKKIDIPPSYRFFRSTLIDYGGPRQNYTDIKTPTPPPPPPVCILENILEFSQKLWAQAPLYKCLGLPPEKTSVGPHA